MMRTRRLAVVPDNLETAEHLTDGEEAKAFGDDDGAGSQLGAREGADRLECLRGRRRRRACGGHKTGWIPRRAEQALVVGLECCDGPE